MYKEYLSKLTIYLYRLTLLFPKKEPLRYKMRELADEILANSLRIRNQSEFTNKKRINPYENISLREETLKNLEILDSFFEIVKEQNWVSKEDVLLLQAEYGKVKENLLSNEPKIEISLNERQKKILEVLKEKEKVQVWEIKNIFPEVSKRTLRRDFEKLVRQGLIERNGESNTTFYKLR